MTNNVGNINQYTATVEASLRYAEELNLKLRTNFGAANAYKGFPLCSGSVEEHPDWYNGNFIKYDNPEAVEYILSAFREQLELGVKHISIDYCRYPYCITSPGIGNNFLSKLRLLSDKYSTKKNRITILVRFPAIGEDIWENYDYKTWITEMLVDFLCPSNMQGTHINFEVLPYVQAVKRSNTKLLPCVDAVGYFAFPGLLLRRVYDLYENGVDGIYVYQSDAIVLGAARTLDGRGRRWMSLLNKPSEKKKWHSNEISEQQKRSKCIYLNKSLNIDHSFYRFERVRFGFDGLSENPYAEVWLDGKFD